MIGYIIGLIGMFVLQDAVASIAFYYPEEKWRWNHTARFIRGIMGVGLMVIGGILYYKGG